MGGEEQVRFAVILAAGNGVRLAATSQLPKPLVPVGERPLMGHVLDGLDKVGIRRVLVVIGYRGNEIQSRFGNSFGNIEIEWVENPQYDLGNGLSLLAANDHVRSNFLLLMADHLFENTTLEKLAHHQAPQDGGVLAVDDEPGSVFDLKDATKVQTHSGRVRAIGKEIPEYDAVDSGMFLLTPEIFRAMELSARAGRYSLSEGIATLARQRRVDAWSIEGRRWIDVDTPEALEEARRLCSLQVF